MVNRGGGGGGSETDSGAAALMQLRTDGLLAGCQRSKEKD